MHLGPLIDCSRYDVIHLTLPQAYPPFLQCNSKLVVTVHDCTHRRCPQYHLKENMARVEKAMEFALRQRAFFLANSNCTRRDLLSEYPVDPRLTCTTWLATDPQKFRKIRDHTVLNRTRRKYGIPDLPYLLALSTLEPRKNFVNTVRAFAALTRELSDELVLVIAGRRGWKYETLLKDPAVEESRVFFTGFVREKDLAAIYSGALAFVFVSHYEGFGLPALEAMSCGIPVIYGKKGSLPEVVADGGLEADSDSVEDIQDKLMRLVIDSSLRKVLGKQALERSQNSPGTRTVEKNPRSL